MISLVLFFPHSIEPTIDGAMKISGEAAIDLGRKIVSLAACCCEAHNKTARWNTIKSLELESLLVFFPYCLLSDSPANGIFQARSFHGYEVPYIIRISLFYFFNL